MGGGHGCRVFADAGGRQQGSRQQTLRHGGTCAVDAQKGDLQRPQPVGRTGTLVDKIAGTDATDILVSEGALFQRQTDGLLLEGALRLLPGLLPEMCVLLHVIETAAKRPLALFLPDGGGIADDAGRMGELKYRTCSCMNHRITSLVVCHGGGSLCMGVWRVRIKTKRKFQLQISKTIVQEQSDSVIVAPKRLLQLSAAGEVFLGVTCRDTACRVRRFYIKGKNKKISLP